MKKVTVGVTVDVGVDVAVAVAVVVTVWEMVTAGPETERHEQAVMKDWTRSSDDGSEDVGVAFGAARFRICTVHGSKTVVGRATTVTVLVCLRVVVVVVVTVLGGLVW